ncbi:MAG: methyltransferase domain-containing protein [Actinomycetota bacterium]|nr:methyltransferase domain-containing protein [Actinomycetota bacterium]
MVDHFSPSYLEEQYDSMAQSYNDHRHLFDNSAQLAELGKLVGKEDRVLDAGCGSGIPVAKYFVERGCEVVGVDISGEMIKLARKNVPGAEFHKADILKLDYPEGDFDLIASFYCIFHIRKSSQNRVFTDFHRSLKPGGYAYFTLACEGYTGEKEYEGPMKFGDHILPYAHFSEEEYRRMISGDGFDVLSMQDLTIGGETMLWVLVRK